MLISEERGHLSHNQLMTMLSCPYKYYLTYIEQRSWDYVPSAVSFGSAVHGAIRDFHKALQNGAEKNGQSFVESFCNTFTQEADSVVFKDDSEFGELMSKGEMLIAQYVDTFQHLKPLEVEMEFRLPLVDTYTGALLDKDVVGRIDMISEDDELYEIKTGSSTLPPASIGENLQLILYGWASRMIFGRQPQKLVLVNLIKTKKPKIQVLDTSLDEQKERKILHLMFKVNEAIERWTYLKRDEKRIYGEE